MSKRDGLRRTLSVMYVFIFALVAIVGDSFITKNVMADSGSGYLSANESIYYSSIGWGSWSSRYYEYTIDNQKMLAYCLEPSAEPPLSNDYVYQEYSSNENLAKTLYYGYGGVDESEYIARLDLSNDAKYILTHIVAAYFYGNSNWDIGLNDTGKAAVNDFINWIGNAPPVPSKQMSFSDHLLTATIEGGLQKTNTVTFNADNRNSTTVTLQSGVILHNITQNTEEQGTVIIKGGDSFYLTAPLDVFLTEDINWSSGDLVGAINSMFTCLIINQEGDAQTLGSYINIPDAAYSVNFSVKWLELGSAKIVKASEDGVVSGLEFKVEGNGMSETVTTGDDGVIEVENLPLGDYTITEISTPDRYVQPSSQMMTVTSGNTATVTFNNVLKKWNVTVTKTDSGKGAAQGAATLERAVYGIYKDGELVNEYSTDENGEFTTNFYTCGAGWTLKEITPSQGYLLDNTEYPIAAEPENFVIEQNLLTKDVTEDVIRGDLKGMKVSAGDMKRMAGVSFRITSVTTGESHVVVTNENGQFDTSSNWNSHIQNTNRGETADDGVWFGSEDVNDDLGALPYDTYMIEELPGKANEGMVILQPFQVKISRDSVTVDLGTIINEYILKPEIGTTATWKGGGKEITAQANVTLIDKIEYKNLTAGREYTLSGVLMDKSTGKELEVGGKTVVSTVKFTPAKANGSVELEFMFDASSLGGKEIVVFEKLLHNNEKVVVHENINDKGQTVKVVNAAPNTPKTGESHSIYFIIALLVVSGCVVKMAGDRVYRRKKVKK